MPTPRDVNRQPQVLQRSALVFAGIGCLEQKENMKGIGGVPAPSRKEGLGLATWWIVDCDNSASREIDLSELNK